MEVTILFPPFRLDVARECVWHEHEAIALKPKTFAVLRYLAEHPEQLVTKDQLLDALWSDVHVGDAVLKTCVREIRRALGDDAKAPRFIETIHRRGYRFIADINRPSVPPSPSATQQGIQEVPPHPSLPGLWGVYRN